jgi:hypothetical protein
MTWLDISVKKWIDIYEYLEEVDIKSIISYLYDIDYDELEDMPYDDVLEMENEISFLSKPIPKINKSTINIKGTDFHLIDFNRLEFGAFIDMEYYLTKERIWFYNLPNILQILFRRKIKEEDDFNGAEWEPYHNFGANRKALFEDILFVDIYGSIAKYLEFRENIFNTYEGMFSKKEDEETDTTRMTAEERKEIEKEKRIGKWGYELLLMKLSNNDPLQIERAMELPLTRAFNLLAMLYELKIGES